MATPNSRVSSENNSLTELIHGRFVDVHRGAYLDPSIRVMIQAGRPQAGQTKKKLVISMVLCEYLLALKQQRAG
jgi:hypothetical protein